MGAVLVIIPVLEKEMELRAQGPLPLGKTQPYLESGFRMC